MTVLLDKNPHLHAGDERAIIVHLMLGGAPRGTWHLWKIQASNAMG